MTTQDQGPPEKSLSFSIYVEIRLSLELFLYIKENVVKRLQSKEMHQLWPWLAVSIAGAMNRMRKITSFLTFGDE